MLNKITRNVIYNVGDCVEHSIGDDCFLCKIVSIDSSNIIDSKKIDITYIVEVVKSRKVWELNCNGLKV